MAIHFGHVTALSRLIDDRPELAALRMTGRHGAEGGWRTPLDAAIDWLGYLNRTLLTGAGHGVVERVLTDNGPATAPGSGASS